MPKYILFFFVLIFAFSASAQNTPWRTGEMEVKVTFTDPAQAQILGALRLNGEIYTHHAWLYLIPEELKQLEQAGLSYSISVPDLNARSANYGAALVPPGYYTFNQIKNIADSLVANFPDICKKVVYGYTPQMKELAALKISDNVNVDENEAEILFDGGIHGDEVGGSQNIIQFARDLCLAYGADAYITGLINNREIWLYYCVNPFGRDYMTRANGSGVDINRDYGYAWGGEGNSTAPFSQPETRALRDCQYSNQFVSYTNYHSGIEIISYPWSYRYSIIPDHPHTYDLARLYSSSSGYQGLAYGQGSQIMYLIEGSTKDFNYGCMGAVAWSMEISQEKQPSGPDIQYYYTVNKPAMLAIVEYSGYGISGIVNDAITGVPVAASVWVEANYPTFTDGETGDFHKYMVPGVYNLRFTANGYAPLLVNNVIVNEKQTTVVNVQLQPEQSQYGYRTPVSNIPNFNAQNPGDETYTAACLGAPDQVNYSIGKGGYVMVDMQKPVIDETGNDITVFEGDATPESYKVYALANMDAEWKLIGTGLGTSDFDLSSSGLPEARFFVIKDNNSGTANVNNAGFDFDAISNLHAPIPDTLAHISGKVFDYFSGLPIAEASVSIGDSIHITDAAGAYSINPIRGSRIVCASMPYYNSACDTLVLAPAVNTTHNFYLDYNVGSKKHISAHTITAVPNPFSEILNISFINDFEGRVVVCLKPLTGVTGIVLKDEFFSTGKHEFCVNLQQLSMRSMPAGIYMLSIETATGIQFEKVIKLATR